MVKLSSTGHVSKANWSKRELKRIRKAITHGNGPRANAEADVLMKEIEAYDADQRVALRRKILSGS